MSESNETAKFYLVPEADNCITHAGLTLEPVIGVNKVDSSDSCSSLADKKPGSFPDQPRSFSDATYLRLSLLRATFIARLRLLVNLFFIWPWVIFLEIPWLIVSGIFLVITAFWLSVSSAFTVLVDLLKTAAAWTILACYLCAFSLQATWITLRNVAVARRGQLTIREVLDSISGNRASAASS